MKLTADMKRVIVHKTMNGSMFMYLFLSSLCVVMPFLRHSTGNLSVLSIFGVVLFIFVCVPRLRFVFDVKNDNVVVTSMTVTDKKWVKIGKRRSFIYMISDETNCEERHHVLPRIYQQVSVGDKGIFVANKFTRTFYFMSEFTNS